MSRKTRNVAVLSALVVLVLLLCFPALPAWGTIYYVSTDGNDTNAGTSPKLAWKTITHAAKKAQAGDLVRIKAGNYGHENVVIASSGTAEAPIRFEGYDGTVKIEGLVKMVKGRARLGRGGVKISGDHIKLSGITVQKYSAGFSVGGRHNTVENCTAGICGWSGFSVSGANNEVRHCTAYNCGMTNIWVSGSDNTAADCWSYCNPRLIRIMPGVDTGTDYCYASSNSRNVHFLRCRGDGRYRAGHGLEFTAGGGSSGGCENGRVTDCEMYNCWTLFGCRHGSHGVTFDNCYGESKVLKVEKGRWGRKWYTGEWHSHGFYLRTGAHDNTVKNCRIKGVRWGLDADNGRGKTRKAGATRNNTFKNCIVVDCVFGVQAAAPDTKVLNCIIARNRYGILIDHGKDTLVKNCIICHNQVGVRGNDQTTRITRCNIWGNKKKFSGKGRVVIPDGNVCFKKDEKELIGKVIPLQVDCISKDPQFVDSRPRNPEWGDWRLKETSPCKEMGPYVSDPKASIGMR